MVESSKILTVSYGTFSCTLEGFEDSFSTMKAIAEYFRDLAADDRYFGAEPPTPDAEMLTRIAEREISRRVEAKTSDEGIHLRAAALPAVADATADHSPAMPPQAQMPETFDASQLVSDTPTEVSSPATAAVETVVAGPEAEDESSSLLAADGPATVKKSAAFSSTVDLLSEDDASDEVEASHDDAPSFDDMAAPLISEVPVHPDADSVAAKLQRIRAVVGSGAADLPATDADKGNAPIEADAEEEAAHAAAKAEAEAEAATKQAAQEAEIARIEEEAEAARQAQEAEAARLAEEAEAARLAEEAEATRLAEEAEEQRQAEEAEAARLAAEAEAEAEAARLADEAAVQAQATAELETAADDEAVDDADASDAADDAKPTIRARILRVARRSATVTESDETASPADDASEAAVASDEDTLASVTSAMAQDSMPEDEDAMETFAAEMTLDDDQWADDDAAPTSGSLPDGTLSPEDEAELQRELAEVEAETAAEEEAKAGFETQAETNPDVSAETEAETDAEETGDADAPEADVSKGRNALPATDDAAMTRIMDQTDQELSEPEGSRRRQAIAQLKAAVAATEAARQLGDKSDEKAKSESAFRDDLSQVVRPRPAASLARKEGRTERPRPAPLKLVASQRIDQSPSEPAAPVAPRRVASTEVTATDASGFAEFASEMGATELADLLEAAAAYTAFVEGIEDFSRPQIMKKVQMSTEIDFSREDGLRSFGTLLREGRISKVRNGRFQISEETRFKPEQKAS